MDGHRAGPTAAYLTIAGYTGLLAAACALPAFAIEGGAGGHDGREVWICRGYEALLWGWVHPAWLANPITFTGVLLLMAKRPAGAVACAAVGLALGAGFLAVLGEPPGGPRAGGYVWVGGFVWVIGGALASRRLGWGKGPAKFAPEAWGIPVWLWLVMLIGVIVPGLLFAGAVGRR